MLIWCFLLGSVFGTPTDEFKKFTKNDIGDFLKKGDESNIVPGFESTDLRKQYFPPGSNWAEILTLDPSNKYFKLFSSHIEKGSTSKGLTFCIYDDNLREAAIALFRLFQTTDGAVFTKVKEWAESNVNRDMYMYALRLESLYSSKTSDSSFVPPFVWNPNYFVNSETLAKASLIINDLSTHGFIDNQAAVVDQYGYPFFIANKHVIINSNYSGWNLPTNRKCDEINYFREDVSLNSYYLGLHLLHPFWMSNEELEFHNPRFAEHYYYAHQQLMARYKLEEKHSRLKTENLSCSLDGWDYIPYLRYRNGLPFPIRPATYLRNSWDEEKAYVKNIDIAIRECISRGLIVMENGTKLTMTEDSHINILAKLIRANLDGVKVAKIIRSIAGYGGKSYPIDEYNPAPSIIHHPETSLKDPFYWTLLDQMLDYFIDYKNTMEPFDLSLYESDEIEIVDSNFTKLITSFDYYVFPVNFATSNTKFLYKSWPGYVSARQRRLKHEDFSLKFTVESSVKKDAIVRLYLGPECSNNCWDEFDKFYELDSFQYTLQEGTNFITSFSSQTEPSSRLSYDRYYDTFRSKDDESTKYSIFRFPNNLLLPRGLEEGLNLSLFIIITPADDDMVPYPPSFYRQVSTELDSKPLGFPFHRRAKGFRNTAPNYKFYNISIYHPNPPPVAHESGYYSYFSPNLY